MTKSSTMANTSMNVSLPETLKDYVQERVAEGTYSNPSDYVRALIREDKKRQAEEKLDALLMEGINSGAARPVDWDAIRAKADELAEAESFEDIARYGRCKREWLGGFLELPNGIPSHDTFRRVLTLVDPDAFERCFLGWVRAVFRPEEGAPRQVAIDGKTVRRSFDLRKGRSPLHLVSAYATEGGIVLAQRATGAEGGELAVLPELLDGLDLAGCLVSLDALPCQRGIAGRVVGRGGDYLLALKGNRRKAHAEVEAWFAANAFTLGAPLRPCFDAFDDGHGRLVRRRVFARTHLTPFATPADWPGLATVVAVETNRRRPGVPRLPLPGRGHPLGRPLVPAVPDQLPRPRGHAGRPRRLRRPHDHVPPGAAVRPRAREAGAAAPPALPRPVARRRDVRPGRGRVALPVPGGRRDGADHRLHAERQAGREGRQALPQAGARPGPHPQPAGGRDRSPQELSRRGPWHEAERRAVALHAAP